MKLLAIVCPNGLGHYRRVTAILARMLEQRPDIEVHLACAEWQIKRMQSTATLPPAWSSRVRYVTDITEPGVLWSDVPQTYRDGRLLQWERRLRGLNLDTFDLVLSDNLSGVLSLRPDAVLAGSFLWSEVLAAAFPEEAAVQEFVEHEHALLQRSRPPMLCVGALATPGVLTQTAAIDIGFTVCEKVARDVAPAPSSGTARVAVLGGATGAAAETHARLIRGLVDSGRWEIALPTSQRTALGLDGNPRTVPFDFTPHAYRSCAAIVARPGLGTVHEALAAGVPLVCSYEPGNFEMTHVARRLAELGLARDFGSSDGVSALESVLGEWMRPGVREAFIRARGALRLDGVERAARWLEARLAGSVVEATS